MAEALSRSRIVDAAAALLTTHGLKAVSLRRVAAELDVTAPALYAHIEGKDDLLTAIGDREFDRLIAETEPPEDATPLSTIEAVVRGYVHFALDRPNAFQLLFRQHPELGAGAGGAARRHQAIELFERTVDTVQDAVDAGEFRAVDPEVTGFALWSVAHGIARGIQLGYTKHDPDEVVAEVVETFANGLTRR